MEIKDIFGSFFCLYYHVIIYDTLSIVCQYNNREIFFFKYPFLFGHYYYNYNYYYFNFQRSVFTKILVIILIKDSSYNMRIFDTSIIIILFLYILLLLLLLLYYTL